MVRCTLAADRRWLARATDEGAGIPRADEMLNVEALAYLEVDRGDVTAGESVEIEIL